VKSSFPKPSGLIVHTYFGNCTIIQLTLL
jgi:hypothetical protein